MNNSLKYVRYKFHWITDIRISFQSCDDKRDNQKHRGWEQWVKNNDAPQGFFCFFFHDYEHGGKFPFLIRKTPKKKLLQEKHIFFMLLFSSRHQERKKSFFEKKVLREEETKILLPYLT